MRLLNSNSFELKEFIGDKVPPYAILSHTWGEEEVLFKDIQGSGYETLTGFDKVKNCCTQAVRDGLEWVWMDTCCIDKSSSGELSEAINSMYRWYQSAEVCYAYLVDVPPQDPFLHSKDFKKARWFTRGWCLQELIAPQEVEFYAVDWSEIGTKLSLQNQIAEVTGINLHVLRGDRSPLSFSVAECMSWASKRQTTREEDIAYCLLGLFAINMPLLYGEGRHAFVRLQEEIIRQKEVYTILLWVNPVETHGRVISSSATQCGLLAESPAQFPHSGPLTRTSGRCHYPNISEVNYRQLDSSLFNKNNITLKSTWRHPQITSRGLLITLFVKAINERIAYPHEYLAWTYCMHEQDLMCIFLYRDYGEEPRFRVKSEWVELVPKVMLPSFRMTELYLELSSQPVVPIHLVPPPPQKNGQFNISLMTSRDSKLSFLDVYPQDSLQQTQQGHVVRFIKSGVGIVSVIILQANAEDIQPSNIAVIMGFAPRHLWCAAKLAIDNESASGIYNHWKLKHREIQVLRDRAKERLPSGDVLCAAVKQRNGIYTLHISLLRRRENQPSLASGKQSPIPA